MIRPALLVAAVILAAGPGRAATLKVGPDAEIRSLQQAARQAQDGDTIELAPGEYFECASWQANGLTIAGPADPATPAVVSDAACEGKAAFIIRGDGVTLRDITFTRVRVPDGNGGGIRLEGRNLTVERGRFVNNQVGIQAVDAPDGMLTVLDSHFERNAACEGPRCMAALQADGLLRLRVERTSFAASRGGEQIRAAAQRTDLVDNRFIEGPQGQAGRLVLLFGGSVAATGNIFALAPDAPAPGYAVQILDLSGPGAPALFQRNTLRTEGGRPATLVRNLSSDTVRMEGNTVPAGATALDESGFWMARARATARDVLNDVRWVAGKVKGLAAKVLHKVGL